MDDALAVGGVERVGNLDAESDQGFDVERTTFNAMLQSLSFKKLHRDERQAVLLVDLVNGADVGMVKSRCGLRLALKAAERLMIFGNVIGEEFEGNEPAQFEVFGFVDNAHASAAQLFQDPVVGDGLTEHVAGAGCRRYLMGRRAGKSKTAARCARWTAEAAVPT